MATAIPIPKLGMTMKFAKLVEWKFDEGDWVEQGNVILAIETEKVSWEVEAAASGFLHIIAEAGNKADVGEVVGMLAETDKELAGLQKEYPRGVAAGVEATPPPTPAVSQEASAAKSNEFKPSSPAARRLAKELCVDIASVTGTGPGGRIVEADVKQYHESGPLPLKITPLAEEIARQEGLDISTITGTGEMGRITKEDMERVLKEKGKEEEAGPVPSIPFTGMRKTIAENMHASLQNTAQFNIFSEADVSEMVLFRDWVREEYKDDDRVKVSYNDILILATSRVLKRFPIMNSTLAGDEILLHDSVNMGIAVSVPEGLIVPVLRNADKKSLLEIAQEARELAGKAREGTLTYDDVTGGTFTISNVSMFDVDMTTPILRTPETGILGVGRVKEKPVVHNGDIVIRSMMFLSLTIDHQVVDGAPACEFLQTLIRYLNRPQLIMT